MIKWGNKITYASTTIMTFSVPIVNMLTNHSHSINEEDMVSAMFMIGIISYLFNPLF